MIAPGQGLLLVRRRRGVRELVAGEAALGRLERAGRWSGRRLLVTDDRRWRVRMTWRGHVEARPEDGDAPVAVVRRRWRRRSAVVWPDGRERTLVRASVWRRRWRLVGPDGADLLEVEGGATWRRGPELRLRAGTAAAGEPEFGALALLVCAAVLMGEEADATAAGGGA